MRFLNKNELKYIIGAALFGFIFFGLLMNQLLAWIGDNPLMQFLVFNVGVWAFLFIFLKALSSSTKASLGSSFGLLPAIIAFDIYAPEFHVTMSGELLKGAIAGTSATDYVIGLFFQSLGIKGYLLYAAVYFVAPIILLLIAAKIFPNFVKQL